MAARSRNLSLGYSLAITAAMPLTLLPPPIVDADISLLLLTLSKRQHFFINEPIKLLKKS